MISVSVRHSKEKPMLCLIEKEMTIRKFVILTESSEEEFVLWRKNCSIIFNLFCICSSGDARL